jgi:hypothetical protein
MNITWAFFKITVVSGINNYYFLNKNSRYIMKTTYLKENIVACEQ